MPEKLGESGLSEQFDSLEWHFLLTECVEKDPQSHVLERCFFRLVCPCSCERLLLLLLGREQLAPD